MVLCSKGGCSLNLMNLSLPGLVTILCFFLGTTILINPNTNKTNKNIIKKVLLRFFANQLVLILFFVITMRAGLKKHG